MHQLIADELVPRKLVPLICDLGIDMIHMRELGLDNQGYSDEDFLPFATELGRVVVTDNKWDYIRLHKHDPNHAGIIVYTRDDADLPALAQRIHAAIKDIDDLKGKLVRVNKPST